MRQKLLFQFYWWMFVHVEYGISIQHQYHMFRIRPCTLHQKNTWNSFRCIQKYSRRFFSSIRIFFRFILNKAGNRSRVTGTSIFVSLFGIPLSLETPQGKCVSQILKRFSCGKFLHFILKPLNSITKGYNYPQSL